MLYILWGLLNAFLVVYFLALCIKASKFVRESFGLLGAVVFVFGLLSFTVLGNKHSSNGLEKWNFASKDTLSDSQLADISVTLEATSIAKYDLSISYGIKKQGQQNIPIEAFSFTDGFIFCTNWKPNLIQVNRTKDNNTFNYTAYGTVEWKLMGATVYTQLKDYRGSVSLTKQPG